jgi:hypothetical protein
MGTFPDRSIHNFTFGFPATEMKIYHFHCLFDILLVLTKPHQKKHGTIQLQVLTLPTTPKHVAFTDWSKTTEVKYLRRSTVCIVNAEMSKLEKHFLQQRTDRSCIKSEPLHSLPENTCVIHKYYNYGKFLAPKLFCSLLHPMQSGNVMDWVNFPAISVE